MADTEGAFRLTFVEGAGFSAWLAGTSLPLAGWRNWSWRSPTCAFPSICRGSDPVQDHRLRLRELGVSFEAKDLTGFLREARLADYGLFGPEVEIEDGLVRIGARAVLGDRQAEFTATGALTMVQPGCARLSLFDVRVYGFLPVPPPLLVAALFMALGAAPSSESEDGVAPLVHLEVRPIWRSTCASCLARPLAYARVAHARAPPLGRYRLARRSGLATPHSCLFPVSECP